MQRFDLFQLIHKGLRAALYHTALQLQQTNFLRAGETEAALNRVREIILLFNEQSRRQDAHILPAIEPYEPSVVATLQTEHESIAKLSQDLQTGIAQVESANSETARIEAGRELTERFTAFMTAQLRHMAEEESIGNTILWRYYRDEELRSINNRIEEATAPWIRDFFQGWMLRGINDLEAANWVNTIQRQQSEIAYRTLLQKCSSELSPERLRSIQRIRERARQTA